MTAAGIAPFVDAPPAEASAAAVGGADTTAPGAGDATARSGGSGSYRASNDEYEDAADHLSATGSMRGAAGAPIAASDHVDRAERGMQRDRGGDASPTPAGALVATDVERA